MANSRVKGGNPANIKCFRKPNRTKKRTFKAKDVGRIACEALRDGESRRDILQEINKCLSLEDDCERLRLAVRNLIPIATGVAIILVNAIPALRVLQRVFLISQRVLKSLPAPLQARVNDAVRYIENYGVIEGQFTRLIDDVNVLLKEAERIPKNPT